MRRFIAENARKPLRRAARIELGRSVNRRRRDQRAFRHEYSEQHRRQRQKRDPAAIDPVAHLPPNAPSLFRRA
jgi:hypothetical protein